MEIREMKAFLVVAEELNFRKAAEILGMSQPPLSRLISTLEYELGVKLFHRTTRSVELTGEGVLLLNRTRHILTEVKKLESEVRTLAKKRKKALRIAIDKMALHSNFPRLASSFGEQFPNVTLAMEELSTRDLEKRLLSSELDLIVGVNPPRDSGISVLEIQSQELGMFISSDNPLAKLSQIKLKDLEGETLIFHSKEDNLGFHKDFYNLLKRKNIRVRIHYKKKGESCPKLAVNNKGILMTSKNMLPSVPGGKFVPFADFYPQVKVLVLWSKENMDSELRALVGFIEEQNFIPSSDLDYHLD